MRKQDLKSGVEYAVFQDPGAAQSYRNGSHWMGTPERAKLVVVSGEITDTFTVRRDGELVEQEVGVKGIVVELLDSKVTRTVYIPSTTNWRGGNMLTPADKMSYGGSVYNRDESVQETERTYTLITLRNAGCFISTWAEYEAEIAEEAKRREQRQREATEHAAEVKRLDPARRAVLRQISEQLTAKGYKVKGHTIARDDEPYSYSVQSENASFTIRPRYQNNCLVDIEVEHIDLETFAHLLGI